MAEDTTDYRADDDALIKRERDREEQARLARGIAALEKGEVDHDLLAAHLESQQSMALYQQDVSMRQFAVQAVVQSSKYESFDELMQNAERLYTFVAGEEAAPAPQTGEDAPDPQG